VPPGTGLGTTALMYSCLLICFIVAETSFHSVQYMRFQLPV